MGFERELWAVSKFSVAEVAQSVEQRPEKPCVDGSIPPLGTIFSEIGANRGKRPIFCASIISKIGRFPLFK